ncbi:MAG: hypothetical protein NTX03_02935 [Bacteroidetes bacterium]|nr:hypothetical protein [Bacteroidota bacterium]
MKKIIIFLVLIIFLSFCRKDVSLANDYFAFGSASGECQGDCAHFYLIKNKNLYPDDLDYYLYTQPTPLKFKNTKLPQDKYNLAIVIQKDLPQYLKDNPNTTFGCPDCMDQGGLHIEIKEKGVVKRWHLDIDSKTPDVVKTYIKEMDSILIKLH